MEKLLSLTPPAVPMWAVYWVDDAAEGAEIEVMPVVTLALVQTAEGEEIRPLSFIADDGMDWWWDPFPVIGYVLEIDVAQAREIFTDEITRRKAKRKSLGK